MRLVHSGRVGVVAKVACCSECLKPRATPLQATARATALSSMGHGRTCWKHEVALAPDEEAGEVELLRARLLDARRQLARAECLNSALLSAKVVLG